MTQERTQRTLGSRIYFARVHRGKQSLEAFGAAIAKAESRERPYSAAAVSAWEHDHNIPELITLSAIAKASGLRVEWLTFESGETQCAA